MVAMHAGFQAASSRSPTKLALKHGCAMVGLSAEGEHAQGSGFQQAPEVTELVAAMNATAVQNADMGQKQDKVPPPPGGSGALQVPPPPAE